MVQHYQSPVRIYKYPFELVMKAYERRFPSCPLIPVVIGCDIISDCTSPDGALRVTERRCKLSVDAPYLLKKIIGVDHVFFIQKNDLNLRTRTLEIEAYNESFSSRVIVLEKCRYFVHPDNSEWTCFEQSASLDIKSFFGFENTIEKLAMKQYSANIAKGKEIIEHYMKELRSEGITHVERWQRPENLPVTIGDSVSNNNMEEVANGVKTISVCSKPNERNSCQQSSKECQNQLDSDYIQRYLGELTPIQESRLIQLRKWVANLQRGKVPSDTMLLRFLRARDFNVEKARTMLSESLTWRKKHNVDRILSEYQTPQVLSDYFPGGWHHHDKDGRPLYLLRLGQMDVKGLLKTIGEDGLLKLTMHVCEEGLRLTDDATLKRERPISTWCLLIDLEGLNMRHLWRPGIKALLRIIEIVEANYPETLGRVLVIRAPRVFPILWTLVSTFIDDTTRSKFLFYAGNDYQGNGGLTSYIPEEYVPDFLGGTCKTKVLEGGLVPKGLYLTEGEMEREGCPMTEDSIYQSVSLSKGQVHEVVIPVEDPGAVITWDFDVVRQDIMFSLLRTRDLIDAKEQTQCTSDVEHRTVIEKGWSEGTEYFRLEQPIICHDGESIQGSHVTSEVATYILQWRYHTPQHPHSHSHDLLESLTTHKAQLMYYYEVLSSADYRGSMSSLQSANSACPSR
ncbi:real-time isoform X2 [Lycorma delicatula]|uniref:real-time isoform X2 n=1 Tax=Lycorma delicatula TaxID=130591 RepID=UPI003F50FCA3